MNNSIAQEIENVSDEQLFAAGYRQVTHAQFMALVYRLAEQM